MSWTESEGEEWKGELPLFETPMGIDMPTLPTFLGMFILDENNSPVIAESALQWGFEYNTKRRRVGYDQVGKYTVSTVFLGLDHRFASRGWPILFETMVFLTESIENRDRVRAVDEDDELTYMMERYSTWSEAEAGHARMIEHVRNALASEHAR